MERVIIHTDFIKLDALLKFAGLCETGGEAKERVQAGEGQGERRGVHHAGQKCVPGDTVGWTAGPSASGRGALRMRLASLTLENYRNIAAASLVPGPELTRHLRQQRPGQDQPAGSGLAADRGARASGAARTPNWCGAAPNTPRWKP